MFCRSGPGFVILSSAKNPKDTLISKILQSLCSLRMTVNTLFRRSRFPPAKIFCSRLQRLRLFVARLRLALYFRNGSRFVSFHVDSGMSLGAVRLRGVRPSHSRFWHMCPSIAAFSGGLFFCISVLIHVFARRRSLSVRFFYPCFFIIRLAVLRHIDHLRVSLADGTESYSGLIQAITKAVPKAGSLRFRRKWSRTAKSAEDFCPIRPQR